MTYRLVRPVHLQPLPLGIVAYSQTIMATTDSRSRAGSITFRRRVSRGKSAFSSLKAKVRRRSGVESGDSPVKAGSVLSAPVDSAPSTKSAPINSPHMRPKLRVETAPTPNTVPATIPQSSPSHQSNSQFIPQYPQLSHQGSPISPNGVPLAPSGSPDMWDGSGSAQLASLEPTTSRASQPVRFSHVTKRRRGLKTPHHLALHRRGQSGGSPTRPTSSPRDSGLIGSLISSLGFRTYPAGEADQEPPRTPPHTPDLMSFAQEPDIPVSPSVDSVVFKPIKKSLLSSLGQGSLTLEGLTRGNDGSIGPAGSEASVESTGSTGSPGSVDSAGSMDSTSIVKSIDSGSGVRAAGHPDSHAGDHTTPVRNTTAPVVKIPAITIHFPKLPEKRQDSFHQMFPSIPADEALIEDFACAYKKDILIQGRIYLSARHLCFHSNIIGLVTHFCIPLTKITGIRRRKTVGIPNALEFTTLHDKYSFASFMSREAAYGMISKVWELNGKGEGTGEGAAVGDEGAAGDAGEGDKATPPAGSDTSSGSEEESVQPPNYSETGALPDTASAAQSDSSASSTISDPENMIKDNVPAPVLWHGFPLKGPRHHAQTQGGYVTQPGDSALIEDATVPAPLGVVVGLLFGDDTGFVTQLLKAQENFDISPIPKFGEGDQPSRKFSYTKPIGGPVGPKQTLCNIEETLVKTDYETAWQVLQVSETPDVPSGGSFRVHTCFVFYWGPGNSTAVSVYTRVVWSGKSWIKGAVERGTISGQKKTVEIMLQEIQRKLQEGKNGSGTGRRRKTVSRHKQGAPQPQQPAPRPLEIPRNRPVSFWSGIMEQIPGIDIKSLIIVLLMMLLFVNYLGGKRRIEPRSSGGLPYGCLPLSQVSSLDADRNAMLTSEADLWDWINSRNHSFLGGSLAGSKLLEPGFQLDKSTVDATDDRIRKQQVDEVIDTVEKRLQELRKIADSATPDTSGKKRKKSHGTDVLIQH